MPEKLLKTVLNDLRVSFRRVLKGFKIYSKLMASDFVDETGQQIPVNFQEKGLFTRKLSNLKELVTR